MSKLFPQHSAGETGSSWLGWVYSFLGKKLAGRLREWWQKELNPVGGWSQLMFFCALYWGHSYLIS